MTTKVSLGLVKVRFCNVDIFKSKTEERFSTDFLK